MRAALAAGDRLLDDGATGTLRDGGQFAALLAIVFVAPLPLGANRPWAVGLVGGAILALLLYHLFAPGAGPERPAAGGQRSPWQRGRFAVLAMAAWALLLAMQVTPLPASWVEALRSSAASDTFVVSGPWAYVSIDPHSTHLHLLKAAALLAFFILLLRLATCERRVELLAETLVLGGCLQAALGIVLFALGSRYAIFFVDVDHRRGAIGTYVNHNHFAGYLELTLAAGIGLMIAKIENRRPRTWRQRARGWLAALVSDKARLRLMLIVMVIALIASRSRMGNAAFFASLIVVAGIALATAKRTPRAVLAFVASLIVLDVVLIGSLAGLDRVMERIRLTPFAAAPAQPAAPDAIVRQGAASREAQARVAQPEESFEQRMQAARHGLGVVRDHLLTGTGGGTFHLAFVPYRPAELPGYFDHAHNDFVEVLAETGIAGFALLAFVAGASLSRAARILAYRRNPLARGMAVACVMGTAALALHGTVDFNLHIPANALTFIALLSLPYLVGSRPGSAGVRTSQPITWTRSRGS